MLDVSSKFEKNRNSRSFRPELSIDLPSLWNEDHLFVFFSEWTQTRLTLRKMTNFSCFYSRALEVGKKQVQKMLMWYAWRSLKASNRMWTGVFRKNDFQWMQRTTINRQKPYTTKQWTPMKLLGLNKQDNKLRNTSASLKLLDEFN